MIAQLAERFRGLEMETEEEACAYEIDKYGVELLNLDGQWDVPFSGVDARRKPWDSPTEGSSGSTGLGG